MAKRPPLKLFNPDEIKRSIAPLAEQLPSSRTPAAVEILPPEPTTIDDYVAAIDQLWEDAQRGFIAIGRHLDEAQRKLPPEQFAALVSRLRFGKAVRSQIMTAYRAVNGGLLPRGIEAAGYSVVYQVATLSDQERQRAIAEGVIRPDMRREEVIAFKRRLRTSPTGASSPSNNNRRVALEAEKARLLRRLDEVEQELSRLDD
ncbi:hypothetical protein HL658_18725 [Azospirillum sp. RWY-5-1]|uniref:DUF3102 domain-containing protein n=1 Tax=Azospirillum oleiclasticum TaxID=2735135 RepID=A0ABX2TM46_9PROT|nr:hypothetical protein [Azospirillum oleiclasticum]NYZ14589.1 hypothetical protein [Azospirillum oleiclasticum]NYZ24367.1 hypothetical protein [Azospirillum oleiclasticum]